MRARLWLRLDDRLWLRYARHNNDYRVGIVLKNRIIYECWRIGPGIATWRRGHTLNPCVIAPFPIEYNPRYNPAVAFQIPGDSGFVSAGRQVFGDDLPNLAALQGAIPPNGYIMNLLSVGASAAIIAR